MFQTILETQFELCLGHTDMCKSMLYFDQAGDFKPSGILLPECSGCQHSMTARSFCLATDFDSARSLTSNLC